MTPASQDFRDGASTGAAQMSHRLVKLSNWGIRIDSGVIQALASGIREEWGGVVHTESVREESE